MDKEKTVHLSRILKRVYRGELTIDESVDLAFKEVKGYFEASERVEIDKQFQDNESFSTTVLGLCPNCGGNIIEQKKLFCCANGSCQFAIWKENKLMSSIGKEFNASMVKVLLKNNRALLRNCVSSRTGNKFNCILYADFSGDKPDFRIELADAEDFSLGKCPKCKEPIVEREGLFGCSNKDCSFAVWKENSFFSSIGKKISASMMKQMLSQGRINLKNCVSKKSGKHFDCTIYVDFSEQYPKYEMKFEQRKTHR